MKFKKQKDVASLYSFNGPRGKICSVCHLGDLWVAKGDAWDGPIVRTGKTRNEAAEKLCKELRNQYLFSNQPILW